MHVKDKIKRPFNNLGQRHGRWEEYFDNEDDPNYGKLFYIEHYINGIKVGYEITNWSYRMLEKIYNAR